MRLNLYFDYKKGANLLRALLTAPKVQRGNYDVS